MIEKFYTVTLQRVEKHLLAARLSIPAETRAQAADKARAMWNSGEITLQYAEPLETSEITIEADLLKP